MGKKKRPAPDVDHVTQELEGLLEQFSDEELESGVMEHGTAALSGERHTPRTLIALLHDAGVDRSNR